MALAWLGSDRYALKIELVANKISGLKLSFGQYGFQIWNYGCSWRTSSRAYYYYFPWHPVSRNELRSYARDKSVKQELCYKGFTFMAWDNRLWLFEPDYDGFAVPDENLAAFFKENM